MDLITRDLFNSIGAYRDVLAYQERMPNQPITLNATIVSDTMRMTHGGAESHDATVYLTFHTYGLQRHDSLAEAERWNAGQAELRPVPTV